MLLFTSQLKQQTVRHDLILLLLYLVVACNPFRPDGIGTVTVEEKDLYAGIKERLRNLLAHQITNFRYSFPFGRPEGALKSTLTLLDRVLMKDVLTPAPPEEVRAFIKKCLENAALVNYNKISATTRIEDVIQETSLHPSAKLHDLIRHAEICVAIVQENNEYYAEVSQYVCLLSFRLMEIHNPLVAKRCLSCPNSYSNIYLPFVSICVPLYRGSCHFHYQSFSQCSG